MANELVVTPASEWRKQSERMLLPSGKVADLMKPSVLNMIMADGNVPEMFSKQITDSISGKRGDGKVDISEANLTDIIQFANRICQAAFVLPRIVDGDANYDNDEITIEDIDTEDRIFVMAWAMGESGGQNTTSSVTAFPETTSDGVSDTSDQ